MTRPTPLSLEQDSDALAWWLALVQRTEDVYVRVPREGLRLDSNLRDELGIDSIGLISVFYAVIDCFELDLDEAAAADWQTAGDAMAFARQCAADAP
jgi:acyl carrier protein